MRLRLALLTLMFALSPAAGSASGGPFVRGVSTRLPWESIAEQSADVDRDGRSDFVVAYDTRVALIRALPRAALAPPETILRPGLLESFSVADVDGDEEPDIVASDTQPARLLIRPGASKEPQTLLTGRVGTVAFGDVDGDGTTDLVSAVQLVDQDEIPIEVRRGLGQGRFAAPMVAGTTREAGLVVSDVTGDGIADVMTGEFARSLLVGRRAFGLSAPRPLQVCSAADVTAGDFTGDRMRDLAVACAFQPKIQILRGDGTGGFSPATLLPLAQSPVNVVSGDFDGDGRVDLAASATANNDAAQDDTGLLSAHVDVFSQRRPGRLTRVQRIGVRAPGPLLTGDFDANHGLDLALTEGARTVSLLLNRPAKAVLRSPPIGVPKVAGAVVVRARDVTALVPLKCPPGGTSCRGFLTVHGDGLPAPALATSLAPVPGAASFAVRPGGARIVRVDLGGDGTGVRGARVIVTTVAGPVVHRVRLTFASPAARRASCLASGSTLALTTAVRVFTRLHDVGATACGFSVGRWRSLASGPYAAAGRLVASAAADCDPVTDFCTYYVVVRDVVTNRLATSEAHYDTTPDLAQIILNDRGGAAWITCPDEINSGVPCRGRQYRRAAVVRFDARGVRVLADFRAVRRQSLRLSPSGGSFTWRDASGTHEASLRGNRLRAPRYGEG